MGFSDSILPNTITMSLTNEQLQLKAREVTGNQDADWIEPNRQTPGLGLIYGGAGVFTAADTQRETLIVFWANTTTLTFDDVSASFAAIGYRRDGTRAEITS